MPRWFHRAKPGLAALLLATTSACADGGSGRVVGVADGDTLTVLLRGDRVSVRLDEIDAPELGQAYGRESRNALARLCYGRQAVVREQGRDKYGRTLARVECAGTDANAEQVRLGYAWFYSQYARDPSLRGLEASARARRAGLWADPAPVPPWEFRHANAGRGGGGFGRFMDKVFRGGRCGEKKTCGEMKTCEEAKFYLRQCGLTRLDRNHDGVPCESLCR